MDFDFPGINERLEKLSQKYNKKTVEIEAPFKKRKESDEETGEKKEQQYKTVNNVDLSLAKIYMDTYTQERLRLFVVAFFNSSRIIEHIPDTYTDMNKVLNELLYQIKEVDKYWAELRVNVSLVLDLPMYINIDDTINQRCEKHDQQNPLVLQTEDWVTEVWMKYSSTYNSVYHTYFHNLHELNKLKDTFKYELIVYFIDMEMYISLMKSSISCAKLRMNQAYIKWKTDFKISFERGFVDGSCSSVVKSSCTNTCFWNGSKCQNRSFMSVINYALKAYCGKDNDVTTINYVYDALSEVYVNWFGLKSIYNLKYSINGIELSKCQKAHKMFHTINEILSHKTGSNLIYWRDSRIILQMNDSLWDDMWGDDSKARERSFNHLKSMITQCDNVYDEDTVNIIKDMTLFLSSLKNSRLSSKTS